MHEKFCSVENLSPNKLNEPVKVSQNNFAGDLLLLDLIYPGFQIRSEPSFKDRELGFNQEPFPISDVIEMISHFFSIFSPDIFGVLMASSGNDRISFESFTNKPMHFL